MRYLGTRDLPVADLVPFPGNAKRGNVEQITASLAKGQYRAIVVAEEYEGQQLVVVAGNHTLQAAAALGWDTIRAEVHAMTPAEARRVNLADNRLAELGDYDTDALLAQLEQVSTDGGLDGTGYDDSFLDELSGSVPPPEPGAGLTDPDDAPAVAEKAPPISATGDVWELGPHRLVCGDATDPAALDAVLDGRVADMVWTDPPYGVSYVGGTKDRLRIANDDLSPDKLRVLLDGAFTRVAANLRPGGAFYVCSPSGVLETVFRLALDAAALPLHQQIVWVKDRFVLGRADYHGRHETILFGWTPDEAGEGPALPVPQYDPAHDTVLYGWKSGAAHTWEGGRKQDTVWEVARPAASRLHPTMKPVELVRRAVENSTRPGGLVLDPFAGSGSTLIACHGAGRRSALVELDPRYVDVICRRWQEHTGVVPVRAGEPVPFPPVGEAA